MNTFFNRLCKKLKLKLSYKHVNKIDDMLDEDFFKDISYPIAVRTNIVIIHLHNFKKFYSVYFSLYDSCNQCMYKHPNVLMLKKYLHDRICTENYNYIYHLQNLNEIDRIYYYEFGANGMQQKILTKKILSEKDFKKYLELIIFEPSEPFINSIADFY